MDESPRARIMRYILTSCPTLYGKTISTRAAAELLLAFPSPFPLLLLVLFLPFFLRLSSFCLWFGPAFDMRADIADVRFMLLADLITSYRTATVSSCFFFSLFFRVSPLTKTSRRPLSPFKPIYPRCFSSRDFSSSRVSRTSFAEDGGGRDKRLLG